MTEETLVVPGQSLKRDKLGAPKSTFSCYRLGARVAPLGEELGEAVSAVGELLPGGEPLPRQCLGAIGAGEALPVVGGATVSHTSTGDHLITFDTLGGELILVAGGAVDVVLLGDEALGPDGVVAHAAHEALLMPLPGLVLHLLHPGPEHLPARVTPGSELLVVAVTAIDSVCLAPELLIHETRATLGASEASFMPVLLFVGEILAVNPDNLSTVVAVIGKRILIAADAEWVIVPQNIPMASQTVIAVVTEQDLILKVPVKVLLLVQTSIDKIFPRIFAIDDIVSHISVPA